MNATARTLSAPLHFRNVPLFTIKFKFILWMLISAVMASGLSVIYMCNANRHMTMTLEDAQAHTVFLETEWDKLLLERSTWSSQSRIQQIAETNFGMVAPDARKVITVKL